MNLTLPSLQYMVKHELGDITTKTHDLIIHDVYSVVNGILTPLRASTAKRCTVLWANDQVVARVLFNADFGIYRSQCQHTQGWEVVFNFDLIPKVDLDED